MSRNEAADRLREWAHRVQYDDRVDAILNEALTVERPAGEWFFHAHGSECDPVCVLDRLAKGTWVPARPEQDEAVRLLERWLSRPSTKSSRIVLESDTRWFLKNLATPPPVPAAPPHKDCNCVNCEGTPFDPPPWKKVGAVPAAPGLDEAALVEYITICISSLPNGGGVSRNEAKAAAQECVRKYARLHPADPELNKFI